MADTEIAEMNSGQQAEISMEQISTMTLSEFKKLINSNLSVPATPDGDSGAPEASRCRDQDGQGSAGGSGRGSVRRPGSADPQNLSWSSVRDKARSVCSSLATSVSSRRPGASGGSSSSSIIARRNLPRSPAGNDGSRPKTPSSYSSAERPKTPSAAERPKTPVSTYRPKTPITSAYAYRPKTPTAGSGAGGGEGQPSRPKTPTAVSGVGGEGQPARPKTPSRPKTPTAVGAYSRGPNASTAAGRNSEAARPKTPTRDSGSGVARGGGRPKTPTSLGLWTGTPNPRVQTTTIVSTADDTPSGLRVKNSSFVYSGEESDSGSAPENCESGGVKRQQQQQHAAGLGVRSPSWASSSSNNNNDNDESSSVSLSLPLSRRSQSPADDLDGDNDEVAEMMSGDSSSNNNNNNGAHVTAASLRERPSTPSRIPKPSFTPRPAPTSGDSSNSSVAKTPPSSGKTGVVHTVQRVLPRPSTPVGRGSGERRLSAGGEGAGDPTSDANKPPVTPRRSSAAAVPIPRSATPTSGKSYMEMFHARRAQTPGPVSSSSSSSSSSAVTMTSARPTTPGPGTSAGGLRGQQQFSNGRRGSLGRSLDLGKLRKAKSVTNLLDDSGGLSYAVHGSGNGGGGGGGGGGGRRSSSGSSAPQRQQTADPTRRSLQRQDAYETEGEVLTVSRNSQGGHSLQVTDQNRNVTYVSGARPRLPQSASFDNSSEQRARSKTPGPGVVLSRQQHYQQQQPRGIIRKPSNPSPVAPGAQRGSAAHSKALNRTEAWVDSTLHDPKRKQLPPRPRRAMTPNSLSIHESDLLSRPLEEIQAALPSPDQGLPTPDPEVIEAPPEDPEMFRKMEQLFEKYREMELRASVCETPGAGGQRGYDDDSNISGGVGSVGRSSGSGVAGQGPGGHRASSSSRSSSSLRTDLTPSASFSSGISSAARSSSCREADSSRGTSAENDRFSKESSPAAAAATAASAAAHHYSNGAASNSGECPEAIAGTDESACVPEAPPRHGQQGAPAVSADDIVGVDAEALASNPSALVSKIKEILQVRPRRDTTAGSKPGTRTRIPAPAPLSRAKRSKSASSLTNGDASLAVYEAAPNGLDVTRDESTNSDVSSDYGRCETPVPKLAQPLTTGRSTLFRRERSVGGGLGGGGGGRSMSQDDHVSTSSSLSSSSRRFWDEDGEFV